MVNPITRSLVCVSTGLVRIIAIGYIGNDLHLINDIV